MYWSALGGIVFWLPYILLSAIFRIFLSFIFLEDASLVWLNAASSFGLTMLCLISWRKRRTSVWLWELAGVYTLGSFAMLSASAISGHPLGGPGFWLVLLFCVFPPLTLWLSLLWGMIPSVLIATVVLALLAAFGRSRSHT